MTERESSTEKGCVGWVLARKDLRLMWSIDRPLSLGSLYSARVTV